jgi:hypothetical protein
MHDVLFLSDSFHNTILSIFTTSYLFDTHFGQGEEKRPETPLEPHWDSLRGQSEKIKA